MIIAITVLRRLSAFVCLLILIVTHSNAAEYVLEDGVDLIGETGKTSTVYADTLIDIARIHRLGYEEIRLANPGVDTWIPGEGTAVRLPTQFILPRSGRQGIVINLAEYRMYYFYRNDNSSGVRTFPISIGRMDWETPLGTARVIAKAKDPSWYPPASIRQEWAADGRELGAIVPPGPDNPLGRFAMRLDIPGYLIHGTNRPAGVGMRVTHGCIRMFPEDIEWLFGRAALETRVEIVNQPFKVGWSGADLYLEVHPPLEEGSASLESAEGDIVLQAPAATATQNDRWSQTAITRLVAAATADRAASIDWQQVDRVFAERSGIPVKIGTAVAQTAEL